MSRAMGIVHVVESLDVGGLEHMVLTLAHVQARQGHRVQIVCLWRPGALAGRAQALGLALACCHKRDGLDLTALWRLQRLLRATAPDAVHTHNAMSHYYVAAALLAVPGRPSLVNTRHGMGGSARPSRSDRFYRWALRRTDSVACVCDAARQLFVARGLLPPALAQVVPNGIDLGRYAARNAGAGAALRAELGLAPQAVVLGTVGRLAEVKQQHRLLHLVHALREQGRSVALVMVGDGDCRPALEQQTADLGLQPQVRLLGARDDVPRLLAGMDLFVLPSRSEGYSLALVEACAAGLPIVATEVGGNGEIVRHGHNGLLVPAGDDAALLQAVRSLVDEPPRRAALGAHGLAWARDHGSAEAMASAYQRLYGPADGLAWGPA